MSVDLQHLAADVEDLTATVTGLATAVDQLATTPEQPDTPGDAGDGWEPVWPSLLAWVEGWFLPHVERGRRARWCPQWADHPEALWRLEALWRTYEQAILEPWAGPSTWTLTHLDPHVAVLLADHGPFGECAGELCSGPRRLDTAP